MRLLVWFGLVLLRFRPRVHSFALYIRYYKLKAVHKSTSPSRSVHVYNVQQPTVHVYGVQQSTVNFYSVKQHKVHVYSVQQHTVHDYSVQQPRRFILGNVSLRWKTWFYNVFHTRA